MSRSLFILSLVLIGLFAICNSNCSSGISHDVLAQTQSNQQSNRFSPNTHVLGQNKDEPIPEYVLLAGRDCLKKKRCLVFLVVEKESVSRARLTALVNHLKLMNKKRELLRIAIFDDVRIAKDYLAGRREIPEIDQDMKALYSFDSEGEILKAKLGSSPRYEVVFQNGQVENWLTETR